MIKLYIVLLWICLYLVCGVLMYQICESLGGLADADPASPTAAQQRLILVILWPIFAATALVAIVIVLFRKLRKEK